MHIQLSECIGCPSKARKLAFDPVQRICAIGCENGIIKLYHYSVYIHIAIICYIKIQFLKTRIFGRDGVEATLKTNTTTPLVQLFFVINEGHLMCVYENVVQKWDLLQKKLVTSLNLPSKYCLYSSLSSSHLPLLHRCTCTSYSTGSKYLIFGDSFACVRVLNIESIYLSSYGVTYDDDIKPHLYIFFNYSTFDLNTTLFFREESDKNHDGPVSVVALAANPVDSSQLLIGYSNSVVTLWDIHAQKHIKIYKAPTGVCDYPSLFLFCN